MDVEKRNPLATKTNVAAVKPMQHLSKLPGPPKGLSRLPRPGAASTQQQKRKASPDRENVQQTSASKRTKLESCSSVKPVQSKPSKAVAASTRPNAGRRSATAVRPSASTRAGVSGAAAGSRGVGTGRPATRAGQAQKTTGIVKPAVGGRNTGAIRSGTSSVSSVNTSRDSTSPSRVSLPGLSKPPPTKKRAPWDMKGRLIDMEALMKHQDSQNIQLQTLMSSNLERLQQLEDQKQRLEVQNHGSSRELEELQRKLRKSEDELYQQTREMRRNIEDLQFNNSSLSRQNSTLDGELSASQTENRGLKTAISGLTSSQETIKSELMVTKINLEKALEDGRLKADQIGELKKTVSEHLDTIADMKGELREEESIRRKLHNTIQELKGNIRVFCRVRPLLGAEKECNDGEIPHIHYSDEKTLELEKLTDIAPNETLGNRKDSNKYEFGFDRVFTPQSTQEEVFEEISQLVQSSLDGYNVCIFAYGQTGSGKTFTMEGPEEITPDTEGMIPRAVRQVFETATGLADKGWKYAFEASFLEIYNESIRDLLTRHADDVKHEVRMVDATKNDTFVTNLTIKTVTLQEEVDKLLMQASDNRAVAETKCNERSSRSHSVFRLKIDGLNTHTQESCTGLLNLIDLAGSERLKESGSQGARLKETQCINKSLSNLGNVIMALGNKESHIPYRNSKLTHLLQNSLGGNSKTLMFVNVSPKEECFNETLNSLRFATKVNNCSIGTATKKVK